MCVIVSICEQTNNKTPLEHARINFIFNNPKKFEKEKRNRDIAHAAKRVVNLDKGRATSKLKTN